jgi:type IX secretion system substrate protein
MTFNAIALITYLNPITMKSLSLLVPLSFSVCFNLLQAQNLDNFELMAHYTLVNTTEEALGTWDTIELVNAPLSDTNGVYSYGGYIFDAIDEDSSLVITPQLDILNAVQFAVQLEVRIDQFEDIGRPIIVVGEGWRYLGFATGSDSTFQVIFNGNYQSIISYPAKDGQWQTLTMIHSTGDSLTSYYVDGELIFRRKGFLDHPVSDTKITNTHFGSGQAFKGYWRNLKVFTSDSTTSPTVDISGLRQLNVFPNPSDGSVTIQIEENAGPESVIIVYDESGRVVRTVNHATDKIKLDNLPKGLLTIVLISNFKQIDMVRIVVVD